MFAQLNDLIQIGEINALRNYIWMIQIHLVDRRIDCVENDTEKGYVHHKRTHHVPRVAILD